MRLFLGTIIGAGLISSTVIAGPVKNVIVLIADGAGYNTLQATRLWTGQALTADSWRSVAASTFPLRSNSTANNQPGVLAQDPNTVYSSAKAWNTAPVSGNSTVAGFTNYAAGFAGYEFGRSSYPDSANTASSLVNGTKTYNNGLNVNGAGDPVLTATAAFKAQGKSTGVVTTVQFSDATPAATGDAHNVSRANRQAVAQEMFKSGTLDFIAGAGNPNFDNNGTPRSTADYSWISPQLWQDLKNGTNLSGDNAQNWNLIQDRAAVQALANGTASAAAKQAIITKSFDGNNQYRGGLTASTDNAFATPLRTDVPTLTELSLAAVNTLSKDKDGFFLTIEQGEVDRAMHANNLGRMIEAYIEFDQTVKSLLDWINDPLSPPSLDDTLIIVTADHDHLLFGPNADTVAYQDLINNGAGNLPGHKWFGPSHSNFLVPLFAIGVGANDLFSLADYLDAYTDAQGRSFGRGLALDQTDVGSFLISAAVPEPSTASLSVVGLAIVGFVRFRKRRV